MFLKLFAIFLFWTQSKFAFVNFVYAQNAISTSTVSNESLTTLAVFANISNKLDINALNKEADKVDDSGDVEARFLPLNIEATQSTPLNQAREGRQLFYQPVAQYLLQYPEGVKCITTRGLTGSCVSFGNCHQFYRYSRQLNFFTLRQWPQAVPVMQEFCTFFDAYGRPNNGVCCTQETVTDGGSFGLVPVSPIRPPVLLQPERPLLPQPPVRPLPVPQPPTSAEVPEQGDSEEGADVDDNIETLGNIENDTEEIIAPQVENTTEQPANVALDHSPDFQDFNNVGYDPIDEEADDGMPVPATYDDYRYQWPTQHFTGVQQQWPPALPTHAPSAASWPPPIPTHPPGHHYPTHPPIQTRPTAADTLPTKKTTTTSTTTSRRPATHRPAYPSYPSYPNYPSYRPTTTTTTTRRPTTVATDASAHGLPQQCGIKNPESPDQERIVGGTNASPNEFPWIVVLFKSGKQFCGGSLITKSHILTAAHCVARMTSWDVASLTAHLGDYDIRSNYEVQHVVRRIKRLVRHKGFEFSTLHNDVAVLTLNEPVKFTKEIQPICLPTSAEQLTRSYSGQVATVAGWGSLRENGPQPSILQKVRIPIWTNSECARKYGRAAPGGIIESMICAGQTAKDSCSGDSGGPMILYESGRYTQVGIVSWGIGCGKGQYPGVYTRVTSLLPWIYKNIKP